MGLDTAKALGFRLPHDPRRDLPEVRHIRKRDLAPRLPRTNSDESATHLQLEYISRLL